VSNGFKHKAIVFNLDNEEERELYDFCNKRSSNFSGFVKKVLFLYMQSKIVEQRPSTKIHPPQIKRPTDNIPEGKGIDIRIE
jgi:hypothetical protein